MAFSLTTLMYEFLGPINTHSPSAKADSNAIGIFIWPGVHMFCLLYEPQSARLLQAIRQVSGNHSIKREQPLGHLVQHVTNQITLSANAMHFPIYSIRDGFVL